MAYELKVYRTSTREVESKSFDDIGALAVAGAALDPHLEGNEDIANVIGFDRSKEPPFDRIMRWSRDDRGAA